MNLLKKRRYCILCVFFAVVGSIVPVCYFIFFGNSVNNNIPSEVYAFECIDPNRITLVNEETLALNSLRKKAELTQIRKDWKTARTYHFIMDGPEVSIVLNEKNIPVKIISVGQGWVPKGLKHYTVTEYDVVDKKLHGRAATWKGKPERVFMVQTFQDNELNGPTIYYSENGEEICRCDFSNGEPWSGRILERDNFNLGRDVSYKEGRKDGEEKYFVEGKLDRLNSFKEGIAEGLQQQYHKGQLRSETIIENYITRRFKAWHQNGQLQEELSYSSSGKPDGIRRMWNESGELEVEEHYSNGKEHGRRLWKNHQEVWFWKGKIIGYGNSGKAEFDRRQTKR